MIVSKLGLQQVRNVNCGGWRENRLIDSKYSWPELLKIEINVALYFVLIKHIVPRKTGSFIVVNCCMSYIVLFLGGVLCRATLCATFGEAVEHDKEVRTKTVNEEE